MRMKWIESGCQRWTSSCGRFEVGGLIWTTGGGVYVRLFDAHTQREYPCRTIDSAKARSRELALQSAISSTQTTEGGKDR